MNAPSNRALLAEMRGWIKDCFSDVDAADLDDVEVVAGVKRHYVGGVDQFVADCYPSAV